MTILLLTAQCQVTADQCGTDAKKFHVPYQSASSGGGLLLFGENRRHIDVHVQRQEKLELIAICLFALIIF